MFLTLKNLKAAQKLIDNLNHIVLYLDYNKGITGGTASASSM